MFAQKFIFPADWDILVTFEPTENFEVNNFKSPSGKFELFAGYQQEITKNDKMNDNPPYIAYDPSLMLPDIERSCQDDPD